MSPRTSSASATQGVEEEEEERPDEERGDAEREDEERSPGRLDELRSTADAEVERLQRGRTISMLGAEVPVRVLIALGVFLVVFMVVWTGMWALGGGLGLALGWIPAAVIGAFAIRLTGQRAWA
jgi:hypothetical protein